jgi:hypothetical protein
MRYEQFRDEIRAALQRKSTGFTWAQLKRHLALPYERPCPEWTRQLEREIGLIRTRGIGRAKVWRLGNSGRVASRATSV